MNVGANVSRRVVSNLEP